MKLLVLLPLLFATLAFSQTDQQKAHSMGSEAVEIMDKGDTKGARKLLKKCEKLDPDNIIYPYEISYTYMLERDYAQVISICSKLKNRPDCIDLVYQMLGNAYDYNKQPDKAVETYEEGLQKFPNSGPLYVERGHMENNAGRMNKALAYYEKGVQAAPGFASNYYWAAKVYLNSKTEVWGMIYGELFMNIERNTKRTSEISSLIYETYVSEIKKVNDTSWSVSFNENVININDLSELDNLTSILTGFGPAYELATSIAVVELDEMNSENITKLRARFIEQWESTGNFEKFPNILFNYHKKLIDAGHFEAYSRWLIMKGNESDFKTWEKAHKKEWEAFVSYFSDYPLIPSNGNQFYRGQY